MSTVKFYYIRNTTNVHMKSDGSYTRGDPQAVVVSEVDMDEGVIRYAVAVAHPTDHFVKSLARHIAIGRLELVDSVALHQDYQSSHDRGVLSGENVRNILYLKSGHEITKCIMQEIERLAALPATVRKVPRRIGKLATQWLAYAALPKNAPDTLRRPTLVQWAPNEDERPTIPAAPSSIRPAHRDAIPPPAPLPRA